MDSLCWGLQFTRQQVFAINNLPWSETMNNVQALSGVRSYGMSLLLAIGSCLFTAILPAEDCDNCTVGFVNSEQPFIGSIDANDLSLIHI